MANRRYSEETRAYAEKRGIDPIDLPLIVDGCSGGLSWLYAFGGKTLSCEECCNRHDIDYTLGGSSKDRRLADKRLRECAAQGGGWKTVRAWIMWVFVRLFGWAFWET